MKKFLTLSMLTALVLVGCNKAATPVVTSTTQTPTAPVVEPAKTTPAVIADEVIAKAPAGCPAKTSVVVKSKEVGTVAIMNKNSWYVEDKTDTGWRGLRFVNFEGYDANNWRQDTHDYKATDFITRVDFQVKDKSTIKPGIWERKFDDNNNFLNSVEIVSKDNRNNMSDEKEVKLEITYAGTDYVCGNIVVNAKNDRGSVNGEFIAKYLKQK